MAILDSFGKEAKTLRVAKVFSTISMDDQALRLQLLNTRKAHIGPSLWCTKMLPHQAQVQLQTHLQPRILLGFPKKTHLSYFFFSDLG